MGIRTALNNGASVKVTGLLSNTLRYMHNTGYFTGRLTPIFYVEPDDGETYLTECFELTHADMVHVTTLMFQKLFPTSSWKLSWKRKDGQHKQWINTEQMVQLVVAGRHYHAIDQGILAGVVTPASLLAFEFFRRRSSEFSSPEFSQTVNEWMYWVFITSELMRDLDCKGDKPGYLFA